MKRLLSLLVPLTLMTGLTTGTGACNLLTTECPLIACMDLLSIDVVSDAPLEAGSYDIVVLDGGDERTCSITVGESCSGSFCAGECDVGLSIGDFNEDVTFTISVFASPDEVLVSIIRDGATILEQQVTPQYTEPDPDAECGPGCRSAAADLAI